MEWREVSYNMQCGIRKFSHFLVAKYSEMSEDPYFERSFDGFMINENSKEIFECIDSLLKHYGGITNKISIKEFEEKFLCSQRQYFEQLLSRCLKLSEEVLTFHDFLFVCVYISKFSELLLKKRQCYKVLKLTVNCLEAVYCRKYKDYFDKNEGFQGLADYCREVNRLETCVKYKGEESVTFFKPHEPKQSKKVKDFECFQNIVTVSLNPMEERFLSDRTYFNSSHSTKTEDFLINIEAEIRAVKVMEMEGWDVVPDATSEMNPCSHCLANCPLYLQHLLADLKEIETFQ